ncbi:hypothetical protein HPP92_024372 [Vanilla planifolia]|uniref:Uncharacterized protein n=1 Tax=Vanilla planifolia TaxID=51239 RepID=A0A835UBH0_VANPL|nr:hypothetical protein HPP92_024372 [Vanilla planifolia]
MLSLGPPDPAKASAAMPNPAVKGMSAAGILQHPAQFAMMSSQAGSAAAFPYVQAMQSVPLKPSTTAEQKPAAGGSGSRAGRLPRRTVLPRAFKFSSGKMTSSGGICISFGNCICLAAKDMYLAVQERNFVEFLGSSVFFGIREKRLSKWSYVSVFTSREKLIG